MGGAESQTGRGREPDGAGPEVGRGGAGGVRLTLVCSAGGPEDRAGPRAGKGGRGDPHTRRDLRGPLTPFLVEDSVSSPKQTAGRRPRPCLSRSPHLPARLRFAFYPRPPGLDVDTESGVATPTPAGPLSHTAAKTARPRPASRVARGPPGQCLLSPKLWVPVLTSGFFFFLHDYLCSWILFLTARAHECFNRA